jgi:hypothetical protein
MTKKLSLTAHKDSLLKIFDLHMHCKGISTRERLSGVRSMEPDS